MYASLINPFEEHHKVLWNNRTAHSPNMQMADLETDLAFNWVNIVRIRFITKRTSQKKNWYIQRW